MTEEIREAQDYQSVGQLSPAAETALTHQHGWDGVAGDPPTSIEPIAELQSPNFSRWNLRANTQGLATTDDSSYAADFFDPVGDRGDIPPVAGYAQGDGYSQTPTASTNPAPFQQAPDGTVSGATAAAETSGNAGFLDPPTPSSNA